MTFDLPGADDLRRMVRTNLDLVAGRAVQEQMQVTSNFTKAGSFGASRMYITLETNLSPFHREGLAEAMRLVAEFHLRHGMSLGVAIDVTMVEIERFNDSIFQAMTRGAKNEAFRRDHPTNDVLQRIRKRTDDALADLRKGYINGRRIPMSPQSDQEKAFLLLSELYQEARRDLSKPVNVFGAGTRAGLSQQEIIAARSYLNLANLIEMVAVSAVRLTSAGVSELGQAQREPGAATPHFPPNVVNYHISVGQMTNSQIMQNSPGSSQAIHPSMDAIALVKEIIDLVNGHKNEVMPDPVSRAEFEAMIESIKPQLAVAKPNGPLLGTALGQVGDMLKKAATGAMTSTIQSKITAALAALGYWSAPVS